MNKKLFDFIEKSPTPFHAVANVCESLKEKGYLELCESGKWDLEKGKGYYVTRNGSSVIAFRIPEGDFSGFMMTASHCDSPCFKIKENAELAEKEYQLAHKMEKNYPNLGEAESELEMLDYVKANFS